MPSSRRVIRRLKSPEIVTPITRATTTATNATANISVLEPPDQPTTTALRNRRLTTMNPPSSCRRTDENRSDTEWVLSGARTAFCIGRVRPPLELRLRGLGGTGGGRG